MVKYAAQKQKRKTFLHVLFFVAVEQTREQQQMAADERKKNEITLSCV